jgi:hypothetical protein
MTTPTTETPQATEQTASPGDFYAQVPDESQSASDQAKVASEKPQGTLATGQVPEGDKPAEAKPAAETPKAEEAKKPEGQAVAEIKLAAPENYLLDKSRVEDVVAFAKEHGLNQAAAEKLLNRENELVAQHILKEHDAHLAEVKEWVGTVTGDKELGGDNLKSTAQYSFATLKQFGSEALIQELNETGYGNHPELVRMLSRIGKAMGPDILVRAGLTEAAPAQVDTADLFYGKNKT